MSSGSSTPAPIPVAGAEAWEREDWLPAESGLDWLEALRVKHVEAVREWAAAVNAADAAGAEVDAVMRRWRSEVRQATAHGKKAPAKPDLDALQAGGEVAHEDAEALREEVAIVVVSIYGELREHIIELRDVQMGADLERSLVNGPRGRVETVQQGLEQRLESLAPRENSIINVAEETDASEAEKEAMASV